MLFLVHVSVSSMALSQQNKTWPRLPDGACCWLGYACCFHAQYGHQVKQPEATSVVEAQMRCLFVEQGATVAVTGSAGCTVCLATQSARTPGVQEAMQGHVQQQKGAVQLHTAYNVILFLYRSSTLLMLAYWRHQLACRQFCGASVHSPDHPGQPVSHAC